MKRSKTKHNEVNAIKCDETKYRKTCNERKEKMRNNLRGIRERGGERREGERNRKERKVKEKKQAKLSKRKGKNESM